MVGRTIKPDSKYGTKMIINTLLIFVFFVFPWALMGLIPDLGWIFFIIYAICAFVVMLMCFAFIYFYVPTISYEIGDQDVIVRKGLITRTEQVVPYRTITNVDVKRGLIERWMGLGSIVLHTAGYSGTSEAEGRLAGLANYEEVRAGVLEALRQYRGDGEYRGDTEYRGGGEGAIPPTVGMSVSGGATLDDVVAELRALRELLEKQSK